MTEFAQIEKEALELTPAERERLALCMWESVIADETATADPDLDSEGINLAQTRDNALETKVVSPISDQEFRDRTSGK